MKKLSLFLILLLFSLSMNSQLRANPFPLNEKGKAVVQEEVFMDKVEERKLWLNAINYATKVKRAGEIGNTKPQLENNIIRKKGGFFVYKKGLFTPQIHGEITFQLEIEVDNYGYKYTFTDFVFQFYQKNRYGQYAPVSGKYKSLEDKRFAGMQEAWEEYKVLTKEVVENHIRVLKIAMQHNISGAKLHKGIEPKGHQPLQHILSKPVRRLRFS